MTKEGYQEYLRSDHWKEFKALAKKNLKSDKCGVCGWTDKQATFHLHHTTYARIGHERLGDVVFLCCYCHKLVHDLLNLRTGEYNPAMIVSKLKTDRIKAAQRQYKLNGERKIFRKYKPRTYFQKPSK